MTHTTLRSEEMFDFCTQMSMILAGGLSVEEGLEIIGDDTDNPHMKEAAACLLEKVHVIGSFSAALEEAPYFDTYAKKMVEIGEISTADSGLSREDAQRAKEAIQKAALECYSIEGAYPQSLEYLKQHYGLYIQEDAYRIRYHYIGANIMPDTDVYPRSEQP